MTTLTVGSFDGLALHAVASGAPTGPVVVLSHSIGCDLAMWDPVAAALAPDFRVLRFDRRGHGRSGVPATIKAQHAVVRFERRGDRVPH